jgi:PAB1-binding protein PBP1
MSLESTSTGDWDQFKANEQRFGLRSDYDENIYTTAIDYKNPLYAQRARDAERIAREIEGTTATNAHVREERGIDDGGADEEEKFVTLIRLRSFSKLTLLLP